MLSGQDEAGPTVIELPAGGAQRLHVDFGSGSELLVTGLQGAQEASAHRVVLQPVSLALQQAAFDAAPALEALRKSTPAGYIDASTDGVLEASAAVSAALAGAVPEGTDDDEQVLSSLDATASGGASPDPGARDAALARCRSAAWDLFHILFFERDEHDGVVAPALVAWAAQHSVLVSAGVERDATRCAPVRARVD